MDSSEHADYLESLLPHLRPSVGIESGVRERIDQLRASRDVNRAKIEQQLENEQVRRLQREGRCPCCGAEA